MISLQIKNKLKEVLGSLPETSDGTVIAQVLGSSQGTFDALPAIRVLPRGSENSILQNSQQERTSQFLISVYIAMEETPESEEQALDVSMDINDNIIDALDALDWSSGLPATVKRVNASVSTYDVINTKTGIVLEDNIMVDVIYSHNV